MDETNEVLTEGSEPTTLDTENQPEANENHTEGAEQTAEGEQTEGESTEPAENNEEGNQTGIEEPAAPFMAVKYNHETRELTEEDARRYAQIGINYENTKKSIYDKLDYAAALKGVTVDELVGELISGPEEEQRQKLKEMYGDDEDSIELGMRIFREQRNADYQKIIDNRTAEAERADEKVKNDTRSRLADEYIQLKAEIPEVPEYDKLPDSVIREAASGKRDLLSAYLLYQRKQEKQIEAAKITEKAAQSASTGQMKSDEENDSSLTAAFSSGVWD